MAINRINLENFTVFDKLDIEFCDGINVLIGENGTGKTHLLKCLYAFCEFSTDNEEKSYPIGGYQGILLSCFQSTSIESLSRKMSGILSAKVSSQVNIYVNSQPDPYNMDFVRFTHGAGSIYDHRGKGKFQSIFIPAKEMLTHASLEKDYLERNLPFDKTLIDILNKSGVSTIRTLPEEMRRILKKIAEIIGGKIVYQHDRYFIQKSDGTLTDFAVEAEGFKKLGLVYRLIETGNIQKGSILFWDEPEANINPKLIPVLVDIIVELERAGVQMFFATHDYVFTKYLELKKSGTGSVKFHSLYRSENRVEAETCNSFGGLSNNSIAEAYNKLLDEVFENNIRG